MELFDTLIKKPSQDVAPPPKSAPLAERMRPRTLGEFTGQEHLLGEGKFLWNAARSGKLPSMILWGPPGCGKTTLAGILARSAKAEFIAFSAVLSGVKEIREVVKTAKQNLLLGKRTTLFVDEIHRFNKAQQDAFLHSVEDGTITLIGATTENPSFEVNAPLLSRCKVLTLKTLDEDAIKKILTTATTDSERGLGGLDTIDDDALEFIAGFCDGDAREALNTLEYAAMIAESASTNARHITIEMAREALQKKALRYDKNGEEHYNVVSAFIKSMRGSSPNGALYWLARMIEGGEDPLFIARRMVIFASEDVGIADSQALALAISVKEAVAFIGMPEGWIPLAHGATYLATAPKSNASYLAYKEARADVAEKGALPIPMHLRNAPTKLMKEMGYSEGYKYPHNYKDARVAQEYLPEEIKDKKYYTPPESDGEK
jgi:putative ATPase